MSALFRIVSLAFVVAAFWQPARASAVGVASVCVQFRASHNAAMSAAGNGWTYLIYGRVGGQIVAVDGCALAPYRERLSTRRYVPHIDARYPRRRPHVARYHRRWCGSAAS
jgi:hypothetical protein